MPHITTTTQLSCMDKDARNQLLTSCVAAIRFIKKDLNKNEQHNNHLISIKSCSIGRKIFQQDYFGHVLKIKT